MEIEYKFKKTDYSFGTINKSNITYDYGVEVFDDEYKALELIESAIWEDISEINQLINEINVATDTEVIEYQVEGGHLGIVTDSTEVAFFDLLDRKNENEAFTWPKEKFIEFLKNFKRFIEENS